MPHCYRAVCITTDQLIATVSGGAALATALATFLTVREIAKQRKEAVRPDLVSERQYAYVYSELPVSCLRHVWSRDKTELSQVLQHSSYATSLINLGTGSAKQIRAEWTIDVSTIVSNVNILARSASIVVSAELVPSDSEIRILWPDKVVSHHLVANQLLQELGHLLPASLSANRLEILVPPAYLTLVSLQIALGMAGGKNVAASQHWLRSPPANLAVYYVDVHGVSHTKNFDLVLTLLSAGHEGTAHTSGQLPTFMQFTLNLDEA